MAEIAESLTVHKHQPAPPCALVIFGASGDLARKKLLPALYDLDLCGEGMLPAETAFIGCARREMAADKFREFAREAIQDHARLEFHQECWERFASRLDYVGGMDSRTGFERLRDKLDEVDRTRGIGRRRIFYLAIPPGAMGETLEMLSQV